MVKPLLALFALSPFHHCGTNTLQLNRCVQREVNRQKIGHKLRLRDEHEAVIIFRYPYSKRWCIYRVARRGGATQTLNLSYSFLDNWLTNLCELCLGKMEWHHLDYRPHGAAERLRGFLQSLCLFYPTRKLLEDQALTSLITCGAAGAEIIAHFTTAANIMQRRYVSFTKYGCRSANPGQKTLEAKFLCY